MARFVAHLIVALLLPWRAPAEPAPACLVEVSLEPGLAIVGEQVRYRARVWLRDDVDEFEWTVPVAFPNVRTEVLPGDPLPGRIERAGVSYRSHDELRALYAERRGSLPLAAPDLLCRSGEVSATVPVPPVTLEVRDPPAGSPDGFAGLVGPVRIHRTVTPRELRLGESVRVAVMLRGPGNVWVLPPPYTGQLGSAELFMHRPQLMLDRGRVLSVRRHFVYELVPREPGALHIPELVIPYFDPKTAGYASAQAPAVTVTVHPRADAASEPGLERGAPAGPKSAPATDREGGLLGWILAGVVLAGVAVATARLRRRTATSDSVAEALREARSATDAAAAAPALERALRAALARHVADALTVAPEQLVARPDLSSSVAAAAQRLVAVERSRFDPEAPPQDVAAVERAVAAL